MEPIKLSDGVYNVGVIDWNVRVVLSLCATALSASSPQKVGYYTVNRIGIIRAFHETER